MDLKGKTILITGAANGIGACLTQQFLDKGSKVIACDIDKGSLEFQILIRFRMYYASA